MKAEEGPDRSAGLPSTFRSKLGRQIALPPHSQRREYPLTLTVVAGFLVYMTYSGSPRWPLPRSAPAHRNPSPTGRPYRPS